MAGLSNQTPGVFSLVSTSTRSSLDTPDEEDHAAHDDDIDEDDYSFNVSKWLTVTL